MMLPINLLFSFMRYLKTVSNKLIDECWQRFLKWVMFSFKVCCLVFSTQMSIKVTYFGVSECELITYHESFEHSVISLVPFILERTVKRFKG